jgi:hypothetical protein
MNASSREFTAKCVSWLFMNARSAIVVGARNPKTAAISSVLSLSGRDKVSPITEPTPSAAITSTAIKYAIPLARLTADGLNPPRNSVRSFGSGGVTSSRPEQSPRSIHP